MQLVIIISMNKNKKRRRGEWAAAVAAGKVWLVLQSSCFYIAITCLSRSSEMYRQHEIRRRRCCYDANFCFFLFSIYLDIPAQVPPLTPGTNKKMTEALKASFASWEKEQERLGIPKGNNYISILFFLSSSSSISTVWTRHANTNEKIYR